MDTDSKVARRALKRHRIVVGHGFLPIEHRHLQRDRRDPLAHRLHLDQLEAMPGCRDLRVGAQNVNRNRLGPGLLASGFLLHVLDGDQFEVEYRPGWTRKVVRGNDQLIDTELIKENRDGIKMIRVSVREDKIVNRMTALAE